MMLIFPTKVYTATSALSSSLMAEEIPTQNSYPTKDTNQVEDEENTKQKFLQLVSTLSKEKEWISEPLHQYQGFWYPTAVLRGVVHLQQHLKARRTECVPFMEVYAKDNPISTPKFQLGATHSLLPNSIYLCGCRCFGTRTTRKVGDRKNCLTSDVAERIRSSHEALKTP
ncbi:hypothetical protein RJ640_000930 [Escallonia rubra]|uniref:Uncharacterized protein n=1 Tax=Escallonia rubra TaxID=112253 RepID=A0AA88UJ16_9ASTE|nr:hypothetical protein RJ640_000930 [Escallonia rubra]